MTSACADIAFIPGQEIVSMVMGFASPGSGIRPPEKISSKIRRNGMIVIAVVVEWHSDETKSDIMSAA